MSGKNANACPVGVETAISVRLLLAVTTLAITVFAGLLTMSAWYVNVVISRSAAETRQFIESENRELDVRLKALEANVLDRWTASNEYELQRDLQDALRSAGVDVPLIDPRAIKHRSSKP